jgi:YidC/Oxa1 family membrane protein insertase
MFLANIFQPLIDIFGPVLVFFHSIIGGSWGWSIIALTVVVRALLLPLAFKQMHSMQKLQHAAPQMKAIQAKYKDDKQRQQQELMKYYKENEINPFGSLLPLVAQIPVFIGLFYTLKRRLRKDICPHKQTAFEQLYAFHHHVSVTVGSGQTVACGSHGGAGFLFINDLTTTGTGVVLVVLILLYVGTQLVSTMMMSAPAVDPTQRRIMMLMPLFFVIFIVRFPAGLIVYWIITNAWTMAQQYVIRRGIGPVTSVTLAGPAPRPGGDGLADDGNGAGAGGLAGLRGRGKPADKQPAAVASTSRPSRREAPPPPPSHKKKRSGRRH